MKKNLFFAALAAIAFASCANNDVLEEVAPEKEVAIGLSSNYVEGSTRANITEDWMKTANSEGRFGVYSDKTAPSAFTVFTNEKVDYDSDWKHSTVRYWDKSSSAKYNFYAYAPYLPTTGDGKKVSYDAGKFTFSGLSLFTAITADGIDDICVATPKKDWTYANCLTGANDESGSLDGHVSFDFNHVLSKLQFKFLTPTLATGAKITVTQVDLAFPTATASWTQTANTAVAGTTTYTSYTASAADTYATQQFSGSQDLTTSAAALSGGAEYIVVPTNTTNATLPIGIKVTYNITYGDNTTEQGCIATGTIKTSANADMAFVQNYLYTINVTIGPATIEFDVNSVAGWTNAADANNGGVNLQ